MMWWIVCKVQAATHQLRSNVMDTMHVTIDGVEYNAELSTVTANGRSITKLIVDCPDAVHQAVRDADVQARYKTRREIAARTLREFTPDPTDAEIQQEVMRQRDNAALKVAGITVETSEGDAYYDAIASGRNGKLTVTVKANQ